MGHFVKQDVCEECFKADMFPLGGVQNQARDGLQHIMEFP